MMNRYHADMYDADGLYYVFDSADQDSEACGPFVCFEVAEQNANDLNTDDGVPWGIRPHTVQRRLNSVSMKGSSHDCIRTD